MKQSPIQTIFFDLDGTIVDSETKALQVIKKVLPPYLGRPLSDGEMNIFQGVPWLSVFRDMFPGKEHEIYEKSLQEWDRLPTKLTVYDGIIEAIKGLSESGLNLAIVSSKESKYIKMDLDDFGLSEYFSVVVGSDNTTRHKPHPDPLLEASRRIGKPIETSIYIGDQPTDMYAARAAGMKCGAALWGEGKLEFLAETNPDYLWNNPSEIAYSIAWSG